MGLIIGTQFTYGLFPIIAHIMYLPIYIPYPNSVLIKMSHVSTTSTTHWVSVSWCSVMFHTDHDLVHYTLNHIVITRSYCVYKIGGVVIFQTINLVNPIPVFDQTRIIISIVSHCYKRNERSSEFINMMTMNHFHCVSVVFCHRIDGFD